MTGSPPTPCSCSIATWRAPASCRTRRRCHWPRGRDLRWSAGGGGGGDVMSAARHAPVVAARPGASIMQKRRDRSVPARSTSRRESDAGKSGGGSGAASHHARPPSPPLPQRTYRERSILKPLAAAPAATARGTAAPPSSPPRARIWAAAYHGHPRRRGIVPCVREKVDATVLRLQIGGASALAATRRIAPHSCPIRSPWLAPLSRAVLLLAGLPSAALAVAQAGLQTAERAAAPGAGPCRRCHRRLVRRLQHHCRHRRDGSRHRLTGTGCTRPGDLRCGGGDELGFPCRAT